MTFAVQLGKALTTMLFIGALSALITGCSSNTEAQAVPGSAKAAKLTQCVRPKAFMRRNHMKLIKHQRDITVHEGVRATENSLTACIACHVQYDSNGHAIPVDAEGQFCNRCHNWLAVQPDCFGCHSTVPEGPQPANLAKQWPEVFGSESTDSNKPTEVTPVEQTAPAEEGH